MKKALIPLIIVLFSSCSKDIISKDQPSSNELGNEQNIANVSMSHYSNNSEGYPYKPKIPLARFVRGIVPHYYEWDPSENPNHYNWCTHAALKMVGAYHGEYRTLDQIHEYFKSSSEYANDRLKDGKFVGKLSDILYCVQKTHQYNLGRSTKAESIYTIERFFQRLKDGVDYNKPAIVPSYYGESYGHMYPVVGYKIIKKSNGSIDYERSKLYLRNSELQNPIYQKYDWEVSVQAFFNNRSSNDILIIQPKN